MPIIRATADGGLEDPLAEVEAFAAADAGDAGLATPTAAAAARPRRFPVRAVAVVVAGCVTLGLAAAGLARAGAPSGHKATLHENALKAYTQTGAFSAPSSYEPVANTGDAFHGGAPLPHQSSLVSYEPVANTGDVYHGGAVQPHGSMYPAGAVPLLHGDAFHGSLPAPRGDAFHGSMPMPEGACKYAVGSHVMVMGAGGHDQHGVVTAVHAGCHYQVQFMTEEASYPATIDYHAHGWWGANWWWVTMLVVVALASAVFVSLAKKK